MSILINLYFIRLDFYILISIDDESAWTRSETQSLGLTVSIIGPSTNVEYALVTAALDLYILRKIVLPETKVVLEARYPKTQMSTWMKTPDVTGEATSMQAIAVLLHCFPPLPWVKCVETPTLRAGVQKHWPWREALPLLKSRTRKLPIMTDMDVDMNDSPPRRKFLVLLLQLGLNRFVEGGMTLVGAGGPTGVRRRGRGFQSVIKRDHGLDTEETFETRQDNSALSVAQDIAASRAQKCMAFVVISS